MKILFIGDIVGRPGRAAVKACLPDYIQAADLVVANAENAAGGNGLTFAVADELFSFGIDVMTMGNHVWDKREIFDFIDDNDCIVRPLNYPGSPPGKGFTVFTTSEGVKVGVVNICGRVFSPILFDDPFRSLDRAISSMSDETKVVLVDFHAEATSEKIALAHYVDGRVTAFLGTHTHVQTADAQVLPKGTGYLTDAGMTGPYDSVIGVRKETVITRFLNQLPARFDVASGPWQFCACMLEVDPATGMCTSINPIMRKQPV